MTLNVVVGPLSKETHEEVALELAVKHLGQEVQVGDEGGLQDDRDVGSVEEFDGIGVGLSSLPLALQCKFDSEALLSKKNLRLAKEYLGREIKLDKTARVIFIWDQTSTKS